MCIIVFLYHRLMNWRVLGWCFLIRMQMSVTAGSQDHTQLSKPAKDCQNPKVSTLEPRLWLYGSTTRQGRDYELGMDVFSRTDGEVEIKGMYYRFRGIAYLRAVGKVGKVGQGKSMYRCEQIALGTKDQVCTV
ncbi:hypothetical protein QBC47DRAFT_446608 [Echria macrotheca]|uniref:Secreted protein n=1 Tax=Echria macrotheca TaxID=438768 RepID=A0AAJ0FB85_9PEZI|nr:hypothetical protein QBC47DRAFT_446608 [Echria macrotheca]